MIYVQYYPKSTYIKYRKIIHASHGDLTSFLKFMNPQKDSFNPPTYMLVFYKDSAVSMFHEVFIWFLILSFNSNPEYIVTKTP